MTTLIFTFLVCIQVDGLKICHFASLKLTPNPSKTPLCVFSASDFLRHCSGCVTDACVSGRGGVIDLI